MKRQLAFVLAAWIGLQQPLGTLEAYAAQPLAAGVQAAVRVNGFPYPVLQTDRKRRRKPCLRQRLTLRWRTRTAAM